MTETQGLLVFKNKNNQTRWEKYIKLQSQGARFIQAHPHSFQWVCTDTDTHKYQFAFAAMFHWDNFNRISNVDVLLPKTAGWTKAVPALPQNGSARAEVALSWGPCAGVATTETQANLCQASPNLQHYGIAKSSVSKAHCKTLSNFTAPNTRWITGSPLKADQIKHHLPKAHAVCTTTLLSQPQWVLQSLAGPEHWLAVSH